MSRKWLVGGALALVACAPEVGAPGEWQSIEGETGLLASEQASLPPGASSKAMSTLPAGKLRVVTYNVERGVAVDGLIAALTQDEELAQAGLVLVQEEERHAEEGRSRAAKLADGVGMGYVFVPAREKEGGAHGLAILSRYPISHVQRMVLPSHEDGTVRIAVSADVTIDGHVLHVIDVHLDTMLNATNRVLQLRPAVIDAPAQVLVAGDFNTNPYLWADKNVPVLPLGSVADTDQAPVIDDYMYALSFDTPTAQLGPTESMFGVESRLDSIYVRGLRVTAAKVEKGLGPSDHWPVWIDIDLP